MAENQDRRFVPEEMNGERLDSVLAALFPEGSRSYWQRRIVDGSVTVNGKKVDSASRHVTAGDKLVFSGLETTASSIDVDLPIVDETKDWLVVDKPAGLLTHAKGELSEEPTVTSLLSDKIEQDGTNRPGVVHRLDRATSGLLIVAKSDSVKKTLQQLFSRRQVHKTYLAFVNGKIDDKEAHLTWPIGRNPKRPATFKVDPRGKPAQTHVTLSRQFDSMCELVLKPKTGRTHQLRVHLAAYGHAILGDDLYAPDDVAKQAPRLCLHAAGLSFALQGQDYSYESELPEDMKDIRRQYA